MVVIGSFTGVGQSAPFAPEFNSIEFNFALWGTFDATVRLEKSFDGVVWHPITANGMPIYSFTAPCCEVGEEYEGNVRFRWNCVAFNSGEVAFRLSQ